MLLARLYLQLCRMWNAILVANAVLNKTQHACPRSPTFTVSYCVASSPIIFKVLLMHRQSSCRPYIAKRLTAGERCRRERCRRATLRIRSAVWSFIARVRLQELKKQEKQKLKASFALLNTVNKPADQTCWLVNAFLEKGADVNIADADGSTPLSSET